MAEQRELEESEPIEENGTSTSVVETNPQHRVSSTQRTQTLRSLFRKERGDTSRGFDESSQNLSHVGQAISRTLLKRHILKYKTSWNVSSGKVVSLNLTPKQSFQDVPGLPHILSPGHSEWFPAELRKIIEKTEVWCDILGLSPPDGDFMDAFCDAIETLHNKNQPIVIRFLFGHVVAMPVDCKKVLKRLTRSIPDDTKLRIWLGAWRRSVSWNHAKIIAVDGRYLHTGGHNWWTRHYLRKSPVLDLSIELEGPCAIDAHHFSQHQWTFCERKKCLGKLYCAEKCLGRVSMRTFVDIERFPLSIPIFPPTFHKKNINPLTLFRLWSTSTEQTTHVPIITFGRFGKMSRVMAGSLLRRPSDDAILAMFDAANKSIRLACQDLGPVCIPNTKIPVPGFKWPRDVLEVLGRAIWKRNVQVDIVVSNAFSVPDNLSPFLAANYGNGWDAVDVAAEITKTIRKQYRVDDRVLHQKVADKLRVCTLQTRVGQRWPGGMTAGLHSKHYIVDDIAYYVGSQNLYTCDLGEWGCCIDDEKQTRQIMSEFWYPMWTASYREDGARTDDVMAGVKVNRDGENPRRISARTSKLMKATELPFERNLVDFSREGSIRLPPDMTNYCIPKDSAPFSFDCNSPHFKAVLKEKNKK
jgi:phosphatidylserine/phosphatidylglycerophosphate/cardiolipin synthase-like enzyme